MKKENFESFDTTSEEFKSKWRIELILTSLLILFSFGTLSRVTFSSELLIFTVLLLSGLYFWLGFAVLNRIKLTKLFKKESYRDVSILRLIGSALLGIQLSFAPLGILYSLLMWPFNKEMNYLAGFGLFLFCIVCIIRLMTSKSNLKFYWANLLRIIPYTIICLIFFYMPKYSILKYKYKGHDDFIKAAIEYYEDDTNEVLKTKYLDEFGKIEGNQDFNIKRDEKNENVIKP